MRCAKNLTKSVKHSSRVSKRYTFASCSRRIAWEFANSSVLILLR